VYVIGSGKGEGRPLISSGSLHQGRRGVARGKKKTSSFSTKNGRVVIERNSGTGKEFWLSRKKKKNVFGRGGMAASLRKKKKLSQISYLKGECGGERGF